MWHRWSVMYYTEKKAIDVPHEGLLAIRQDIIDSQIVLYVSRAVYTRPLARWHGITVFRSEIVHCTLEIRFRRHEEMIGDTRKCRQQRDSGNYFRPHIG